jgi:mevalonate kinase
MKKPTDLHANGKLLITGEYLVLKGAKALALPVRFGQDSQLIKTDNHVIEWESTSPEGVWFSGKFDSDSLEILESNNINIAKELVKLLSAARKLSDSFFKDGHQVKIHAGYPIKWGLGSSSTLCYLVANMAGVNAFELNRMVSTSSGYDVACAGQSELLFYQLKANHPEVILTHPDKALSQNTYFAYLGNKQDTKSEVKSFLAKNNFTYSDVEKVTRLSDFICYAQTVDELIYLVKEHEAIISFILKQPTIAAKFPDFPGTVKSLGAWGGDFAMFVSGEDPKSISQLLHKKGFTNLFSYAEIKAQ